MFTFTTKTGLISVERSVVVSGLVVVVLFCVVCCDFVVASVLPETRFCDRVAEDSSFPTCAAAGVSGAVSLWSASGEVVYPCIAFSVCVSSETAGAVVLAVSDNSVTVFCIRICMTKVTAIHKKDTKRVVWGVGEGVKGYDWTRHGEDRFLLER